MANVFHLLSGFGLIFDIFAVFQRVQALDIQQQLLSMILIIVQHRRLWF
jgi:hypothetical protein